MDSLRLQQLSQRCYQHDHECATDSALWQYLSLRHSGSGGFALTFSGGGIRAASQGIGSLRFLQEKGLLHAVQYLSGVSGGTYSGTGYVSHILAQRTQHPKVPETAEEAEQVLSDAVDSLESHLRSRGNLVRGIEGRGCGQHRLFVKIGAGRL